MPDLRTPDAPANETGSERERLRAELEPGRTTVDHGLTARIKRSDAWQSVFRHAQLDTPRGRALQSFSNFFLHLYPVKIPQRVLRMRYSFRLGFIAAMLFLILLVTGVYLMFVYTPSVGAAYGDMQHLKTGVGFGQLIRNVHRWSAHLMVLTVGLHLVRVFYAGAYKTPREFNWVIGVVLLMVTLMFSFTGYLLPWDQLSYWAVTVGTNLVSYVPVLGGKLQDLLIGGPQIGQNTLLRFYALHVAVLPTALSVMLMVHIWRVRKDGFAVGRSHVGAFAEGATRDNPSMCSRVTAPAPAAAAMAQATPDLYGGRVRLLGGVDRESVVAEERPVDDTVFSWPHLLVRHVVTALGITTLVLVLGVAFSAPLRDIANPNLTPEPAKAPWYFAGLQELLSHFDPLVAGIFVPTAAVLIFVFLPYLDRNPDTRAAHRKVAISLFTILLGAAIVLTVIGTFFRGPGWQFVAPWTHSYIEF